MSHLVAVLALEGVKPFDLGIPAQVFGPGVNAAGKPLYEVVTCSLGGRPVTTNQDFAVTVSRDQAVLATADTVVIPPQDYTRGIPIPSALDAELADALAGIAPSARIVSLCTSAFVLAVAGLLDGQRATTHWGMCGELARRFPGIEVDENVLFVDNGRVLTSAGAAAGIDLCLHLVRQDHGAAIANATARRCVVAPWREGGQAQFIEQPVPAETDLSTSATRSWALGRLSEPLTLTDLAQHANMSVRTFTRRFRSEVGQSPHEWVIQHRLNHARDLLETSELPIGDVANAAGFADPVLLRKHLRNSVGLTPNAYRKVYSTTRPEDRSVKPRV